MSLARAEWFIFPESTLMDDCPAPTPYFRITEEFWKRPRNAEEVVNAVHWAARGDVPLEAPGPDFLVANLVEPRNKRRRLVHLLNYNTQGNPAIEGIDVKCEVPEGQVAKDVTLYSPDSDDSPRLNFRMEGSMAVFTVPRLGAYCMVAVSW